MSFFSEFSQKSRDMSEINAINNLIRNEENTIELQYNAMGKLYIEKHGNEPEPEFEMYIKTIDSAREKIEKFKKDVQKIQSRYNCPNCGEPFRSDATFCAKCGTKLPPREMPIPAGCVKCTNCGNIVKKDSSFCNVCGSKIEAAPIPNNMKKCKSCGNLVGAEVAFCNNCGFNFKKENENSQVAQPETKTCPECGNVLTSDAMFCNSCGYSFNSDKPENQEVSEAVSEETVNEEIQVQEETQAQEASQEEAETQPETKTCPECGNVLTSDAMFCNSCGYSFDGDKPENQEASEAVSEETANEEVQVQEEETQPETKTCPECGNVLPNEALFCNQCGYSFGSDKPENQEVLETASEEPVNEEIQVQEETQPKTKTCPECGNVLPNEALFCNQCGYSFGGDKPVNEEIQVQEEETQPKTKTCSECGNVLPNEALFCNQCGAKIE